MDYREMKQALLSGSLDAHLDEMSRIIKVRQEINAPQVWDFIEGQTIQFNNRVNPKYLRGAEAVVKKINRTRVVVDLVEPRGRFSKNITVPLTLIER
jgi:hypothetical protein